MDFQKIEPGGDGCETSLDHAAEEIVPSAAAGLPDGVSEALGDPIVTALMAADGVDSKSLEELLRRTAAQLAQRAPQNGSPQLGRRESSAVSTGLAMLAKGSTLVR